MFNDDEDYGFLTGGLGDLDGDGRVDFIEYLNEEDDYQRIMGNKDDDDYSVLDDDEDIEMLSEAEELGIDLNDYFEPTTPDKIVEFLTNMDTDFTAKRDGVQLHTAKYNKDGQEMHFIVNNTRGIDAELTLNHKTKSTATLYDPVDGGVKRITVGEKYTVPSFRSMFVVFD